MTIDLCTGANISDFLTVPIHLYATTLQDLPFLTHELHTFDLNTLGTLIHALTHLVLTLDTLVALTHLALSHTYLRPWRTGSGTRGTVTHVIL